MSPNQLTNQLTNQHSTQHTNGLTNQLANQLRTQLYKSVNESAHEAAYRATARREGPGQSGGGVEVLLAELDVVLADLEGFHEHGVVDERGRAEQGAAHLLHAGVLAAEHADGHGGRAAHVHAEVDEALGEQEQVAHGQRGGEQVVGGVHEAGVQGALRDDEELGRAGVDVGHHDAALGEVLAREAEVLAVQGRQLRHQDGRDGHAVGVVDVARRVEAVVREVRDVDVRGVLALHVAVHPDMARPVRHAVVLEPLRLQEVEIAQLVRRGQHGHERGVRQEGHEHNALQCCLHLHYLACSLQNL